VNQTVSSHPSSHESYMRHGWQLVPIPPNSKGPHAVGWNTQPKMLPSANALPPGYGIGLAHAYSGTAGLDIDNWGDACVLAASHGVDLPAIYTAPDGVVIESGRPGHGKLLFQMPPGMVLPSKKFKGVDAEGKQYDILEFRCGTANGLTVQDVLPPSIHPDTKQPYRWSGNGHWQRLPLIPEALLAWWLKTLERDAAVVIPSGDAIPVSWDQIHSAIGAISPDCARSVWLDVGMALHWTASKDPARGLEAFGLWDEWSSGSAAKYPGPRAIVGQWNSFRADKTPAVTLGSLFHHAQEAGWVRPLPDVSAMFSALAARPVDPLTLVGEVGLPAPELDLSLWPPALAQRAQEVSDGVGCDPLVPLFAGLSAVCAAVDARSRLEIMPDYKVPPVLWLMTIGSPAEKKTPGSTPMMTVLHDLEAEDRAPFAARLLDWEMVEAHYASAKKDMIDHAGSPEFLLNGSAAVPALPHLPAQPVPVRLTVSDITSQKLVRHCAERPRGVLCYLDEMHAWFRKMTSRDNGDDRSAWTKSYESQPYSMDRVQAGALHCENFAVSIYGNVQPQVLKQHADQLTSDGLLQRFIPAILRPRFTHKGHPLPPFLTSKANWEQIVRTIYSLPPMDYELEPGAFRLFREFQDWYDEARTDERYAQAPDRYMQAFGKLEGTLGRLAFMFHLIENPFCPYVSADTMARAIAVVKDYVVPAFRYTLGDTGALSPFERWLSDWWIQHSHEQQIPLHQIRRSARRPLEGMSQWQQEQAIIGGMQNLEAAGWAARLDDGTQEHQHRAIWVMNPTLISAFKEHRERIIRAKQRIQDQIGNKGGREVRQIVTGYDPATMDAKHTKH